MSAWLQTGDDGVARCWWPGTTDDYLDYHDHEWGRPVVDDIRLFEKLCLEGFQSGLSWITILRKRDNFRAAFAGFDPERVAAFGEPDVVRMLDDAGIVFALDHQHGPDDVGGVEQGRTGDSPVPATTPTSIAIAKDLKKRGWSFVGPTTVYAFMQAMGLVNDHVAGCAAGAVCEAERAALIRPGQGTVPPIAAD